MISSTCKPLMTTLQDVCEDVRRISSASDLPVLVDVDTGWGDVFMIGRTIKEMINAGAAACHLEDQVDTKRCGHRSGKILVTANEMTNRNVNLLPVISFLTLCSNLNTWKIIRRNRHTTKAIEITSKTIKVSFDTNSLLDNDCAKRIKNPNPRTATEVIRYFIIYSYRKLLCLNLHPTTC